MDTWTLQAPKAERRADILAAALACFARTGYHSTTMAEVAEAAENPLPPGSLIWPDLPTRCHGSTPTPLRARTVGVSLIRAAQTHALCSTAGQRLQT